MNNKTVIYMWDAINATDEEYEWWKSFKDTMTYPDSNIEDFIEVRDEENFRIVKRKLEDSGWKIGLGGSHALSRIFSWTKDNNYS